MFVSARVVYYSQELSPSDAVTVLSVLGLPPSAFSKIFRGTLPSVLHQGFRNKMFFYFGVGPMNHAL